MRHLLRRLVGAIVATLCWTSSPAVAHPHVFVDAKTEVIFDASGAITGIRNIWLFDKAFSVFATSGLDKNHNGKLDDDELKPLAKVNVESLKEYDYFTYLTVDDKRFAFGPAKDYHLEHKDQRLTLFYTLPLQAPVRPTAKTTLEVFDPEYFVAFTFAKETPVRVVGAPSGCTAKYQPPHELDAKTMGLLASIPAEQHDLPPALVSAAAGLAHLFRVSCAGAAAPEIDPNFDRLFGAKPDDNAPTAICRLVAGDCHAQ